MTLQEFYDKAGGDYDATMDRLFSDEIAMKYLKRFLEDDTFQKLEADIASHDDKQAFNDVHTLKGVALNLGLDRLGHSASDLTEVLRHGGSDPDGRLFAQVSRDYADTIDLIKEL
ncbi:MAG: Hpt domain-containing protein [Lachnospiraceae bacterium]|nr:Hpt domain-containing protein [Lachnospiraceae bacterium]